MSSIKTLGVALIAGILIGLFAGYAIFSPVKTTDYKIETAVYKTPAPLAIKTTPNTAIELFAPNGKQISIKTNEYGEYLIDLGNYLDVK